MNVLIVSKTKMASGICVGGMLMNGQPVRLLTSTGSNQPFDTSFQIGQVWDMALGKRSNCVPPHVEDVIIRSKQLKGKLKPEVKMLDYLRQKGVNIWEGPPDDIFDGMLCWTDAGSGYINKSNGLPSCSVGFWLADKALQKKDFHGIRYQYPTLGCWRSLAFVGSQSPVDEIPAGTLIRVSLARWWNRNGETEDRCSLQLSGWY